jgi:acid phosphatase family membrane protein YuiD
LNGAGNHLVPWEFMFLLGLATQLMKLLLYGIANRRLNLRVLVTTNAFPSLHAVVLSCLSIVTGLDHGFRSPFFVATFIFTGVVLHDLIKVQGSVQKGQATGLFLARAIDSEEPGSWSERWVPLLSDRGHRPMHVGIGMLLGILIAIAWGAP